MEFAKRAISGPWRIRTSKLVRNRFGGYSTATRRTVRLVLCPTASDSRGQRDVESLVRRPADL